MACAFEHVGSQTKRLYMTSRSSRYTGLKIIFTRNKLFSSFTENILGEEKTIAEVIRHFTT